MPSTPTNTFIHHYVDVFDLTAMQAATASCNSSEFSGKPLRLELIFTFLLNHVTEVCVLGQQLSLAEVD